MSRVAWVLVGLSLLVVLGFAVRGWVLERSQLARVLLWLDADPGDLHRFPARIIATGPERFDFHPGRSPEAYGEAFAPVTFTVDDVERLIPFDQFLERHQTTAFLVVRRDTLLYERYFAPNSDTTTVTTFSVAKSLVSMAVGLALDAGSLASAEDPITDHVPELAERDPAFADITLEHLLQMRSGIRFERGKSPWGHEATTYYNPDLRSVALSAEVAEPPGGDFHYNYYNPLLLGLAVERASGLSVSEVISQRVWRQIGTEANASWSLDSRTHGFEKMESGFNARPRDLARLGRLYLRGGEWNGERILSEAWVERSLRPLAIEGRHHAYGYMWWIDSGHQEQNVEYAHGRFGQFVAILPDAEVIVVRTGVGEADVHWASLFALLGKRLSQPATAPLESDPARQRT